MILQADADAAWITVVRVHRGTEAGDGFGNRRMDAAVHKAERLQVAFLDEEPRDHSLGICFLQTQPDEAVERVGRDRW